MIRLSDESLRLLETALCALTLSAAAVCFDWPAPAAALACALGTALPALVHWLRTQAGAERPFPRGLQTVLDQLPCAIYIKDPHSRYTLVNKTFLAEYGLGADAARQLEPEVLFGPVYGDMIRHEDQRVLAGEVIDKQETGTNPLTGQARSQRVIKQRLDLPGGPAAIIGCNLNLTPWQQAEASLEAALLHEQLLRRRERDFLQRLLDASPHALCLTDAEGCLVQVNASFARWQGVNAETVIGRELAELAGEPGQAERWRKELRAALNGERIEYEFTVHEFSTPGVSHRQVRRSRIAAPDARPLVLSLYTDISQTKDTEQALQDALERERRHIRNAQDFALRLINALPFPVYLLDRDARFTGANQAMAQECGCLAEALLGQDLEALAPPKLDATWRETERALTRAAFDGEGTDDEFALTHPFTGKPCLWRVGRIGCEGADGSRLVLGYHLDHSAALEAEATLRQHFNAQAGQHAFFRRAIEHLPTPVFMENQQGQLLFANQALARLLGHPLEQLPGRTGTLLGLPSASHHPAAAVVPPPVFQRPFLLHPLNGKPARPCIVTELWIEAPDGGSARLVSLGDAEAPPAPDAAPGAAQPAQGKR